MPTQQYRLGTGARVPGVTTVIGGNLGWNKDVLMKWANREGLAGRDIRERRDAAADAGTLAHTLVETFIHGDQLAHAEAAAAVPAAIREPALEAFGAFLNWHRQSQGTIVATELWGVDEEYQTGWCLDAIRLDPDGKAKLVDWKSSKGTYADHFVQISAYLIFFERAWTRATGEPLELAGADLCRFSKESGAFTHHYWPRAMLLEGWKVFTWLRALHQVRWQIEGYVR